MSLAAGVPGVAAVAAAPVTVIVLRTAPVWTPDVRPVAALIVKAVAELPTFNVPMVFAAPVLLIVTAVGADVIATLPAVVPPTKFNTAASVVVL